MVDCPNCSNQFEADFGMVSCPSCQHIVIVGIDGKAQASEPESQGQSNDQGNDQSFDDFNSDDPALAETLMAQPAESPMERSPADPNSRDLTSRDLKSRDLAQSLVDESLSELNDEIPYESSAEEQSFANYQMPSQEEFAEASDDGEDLEQENVGNQLEDDAVEQDHYSENMQGYEESSEADAEEGESNSSQDFYGEDYAEQGSEIEESDSNQQELSEEGYSDDSKLSAAGQGGVDEEEGLGSEEAENVEVVSSDLDVGEEAWLSESSDAAAETPADGSVDFSDVEDYGNSEVSTARDGLYFYDLRISNIDSASVRKELEDILEDRKFAWNAKKVMGELENGVLVLEKLNPIKASIIVNRIKGTSLRVQWKQNALTQMDA